MSIEVKPSIRPLEEVLRAIKECLDDGVGREKIVSVLAKCFLSKKTGKPYTENAISGMVNRNREKYGLYFTNVKSARKPGEKKRTYKKEDQKKRKTSSYAHTQKKFAPRPSRRAPVPRGEKQVQASIAENVQKPQEPDSKEELTLTEHVPIATTTTTEVPVALPRPWPKEYTAQVIRVGKKILKDGGLTFLELTDAEDELQRLYRRYAPDQRPAGALPKLCRCEVRGGHRTLYCGILSDASSSRPGVDRCKEHKGKASSLRYLGDAVKGTIRKRTGLTLKN